MQRNAITTQVPDLVSFYFLSDDGTLAVCDKTGECHEDHEATAAFRDHAKRLLATHLSDPQHSAIRLAIVAANRGHERWKSPTLIFDEVMLRALYPVAGAKRARLTDFQRRNKEKSIYQGIEILLDYRLEAAPDTPFYLPVLFDNHLSLADYSKLVDRQQESGDETIAALEVLNLIADIPLNKKAAPEVVELHRKIRDRCIDRSLRTPIEFEMVESTLPETAAEPQGEAEYYDADRRRADAEITHTDRFPTGRQAVLPDGVSRPAVAIDGTTPMPILETRPTPKLFTGAVTPELLRFFIMFRDLDTESLTKLTTSTHAKKAVAGDCLIERGTADDWNYFLVEGIVELEAADGVRRKIESGHENARSALSYLLPRKYEVVALTSVTYLQIHDGLIRSATAESGLVGAGDATVLSPVLSLKDNPIMQALCTDLANGSLELPSSPDAIKRLRAALSAPGLAPQQLVEAIEADPVMSARLLQAAALGDQAAEFSVSAAVDHLGVPRIRELSQQWTAGDRPAIESPYLNERLTEIWQLSHEVGEIASLLARISPPLDPDRAFLAGLLHELGSIAILHYAARYPELADDGKQIERFISKLEGEIGAKALRQWGIPADIALAAEESGEWFRDSGEAPDYCDLVLVAKLHSLVGTSRMGTLPPMDKLPAFRKLAGGRLTPAASLEIVRLARSGQADARRLPAR
jgi:HD-like signal output (HDOD) protein